ncbi:transposon Tf2-6 polyprotein [Trichonephila clavipes]|nr:transposon Tf2-6 polyprotein [Trichonephila clavipes]
MLPFCPNDFDDNNITKIAARAEESRQLARVRTLRAQDKDRRRYDSKHQMVSYAPGDLVILQKLREVVHVLRKSRRANRNRGYSSQRINKGPITRSRIKTLKMKRALSSFRGEQCHTHNLLQVPIAELAERWTELPQMNPDHSLECILVISIHIKAEFIASWACSQSSVVSSSSGVKSQDLEANSQVQNVKLGGHQTCLSINRLWHELYDMLRRLVGTTAPDHNSGMKKVSNHGYIPRSPLTVTLWPSSFLKKYGPMIPPAHKAHKQSVFLDVTVFRIHLWISFLQMRQFCLLT